MSDPAAPDTSHAGGVPATPLRQLRSAASSPRHMHRRSGLRRPGRALDPPLQVPGARSARTGSRSQSRSRTAGTRGIPPRARPTSRPAGTGTAASATPAGPGLQPGRTVGPRHRPQLGSTRRTTRPAPRSRHAHPDGTRPPGAPAQRGWRFSLSSRDADSPAHMARGRRRHHGQHARGGRPSTPPRRRTPRRGYLRRPRACDSLTQPSARGALSMRW